MNRWLSLSVSAALIVLGGCGTATDLPESSSSDQGTVSETPEPTETDPPEPAAESDVSGESVDPAFLISENGIGPAQLGMTLGDLKAALPPDTEYSVESPFIVDFDAISVAQGGDTQFYLLYLSGEAFTDDDIIQGVLTTNPDYKTAEGVGVSTPIQEAETHYGQATLSYNLANESREYVRFENHPAGNLAFGLRGGGAASTDYQGIYPDSAADYNETQEYVDGAAIQTVLAVCVAEACTL
jgi:hypothetical protein